VKTLGIFSSVVLATLVFLFVATVASAPYVLLDGGESRIWLGRLFGYVAVISLSSSFVLSVITIVIMEIGSCCCFERDSTVVADIKSALLWISSVSGLFTAMGFVASAIIPMVWWGRIDYRDVGLYDGSIMLNYSVVGGEIGVVVGMISMPYAIDFFDEVSLSPKSWNAPWNPEKIFYILGPGFIFLLLSLFSYVVKLDAVNRFYRFGGELLDAEHITNCEVQWTSTPSVGVSCAAKELSQSGAIGAVVYYIAVILILFVSGGYRYFQSKKKVEGGEGGIGVSLS